eukprot:EG_transcript_25930
MQEESRKEELRMRKEELRLQVESRKEELRLQEESLKEDLRLQEQFRKEKLRLQVESRKEKLRLQEESRKETQWLKKVEVAVVAGSAVGGFFLVGCVFLQRHRSLMKYVKLLKDPKNSNMDAQTKRDLMVGLGIPEGHAEFADILMRNRDLDKAGAFFWTYYRDLYKAGAFFSTSFMIAFLASGRHFVKNFGGQGK